MKLIISLFTDYTFLIVALGSLLVGALSGVLASFCVLRRQALLGDGVSHAALPGIILMFLLTGSKSTPILLLGALLSGLLALLLIFLITKYSRIKFDSALALIMSVFFGLGLVLLTYSQKIPNAQQAGLKQFIYGQASAMLAEDLIILSVCSAVILLLVILFWKQLKLICFDIEFAHSVGLSTNKITAFLSLITVISIVIGLQTVGVILMSAMLVTPAVAARQWSNRLSVMVILSAAFGAASGFIGTALSCILPDLPTGPLIVLCVTIIAILSLLFAPGRGILYRIILRAKEKRLYDACI